MDWALAVTVPNSEHIVCAELTHRLEIPHHFFLRQSCIVRAGKVLEHPVPAFPKYVFVPFERAWDAIRSCWRIIKLVGFGEDVSRIGQSVIDDLIARCGGGSVLPALQEPEPFRFGERVHVDGYGVMAGHDGVYQNRVDGGKLCVLFDWAGRWVPIDVDERDVCGESAVSTGRVKKKRKHRSRRRHKLQSLS